MATVWCMKTNPNNSDQFYVLWTNGRVDAYGGAPDIPPHPDSDWTGGTLAPGYEPARGLEIVDWDKPSGYIMSWFGGIYPFGDATAPASNPANLPDLTGIPAWQATHAYYFNNLVLNPTQPNAVLSRLGPSTDPFANWEPSHAYTAGTTIKNPFDGAHRLWQRIANGTSRPSVDATEVAAWNDVTGIVGELSGLTFDSTEAGRWQDYNATPLFKNNRWAFAMDPAGNGEGYVVDNLGNIWAVGGAPAVPQISPIYTTPNIRQLLVFWDTHDYMMLGQDGAVWYVFHGGGQELVLYPPWPGQNIARAMQVFKGNPRAGYMLDYTGPIHTFGGGVMDATSNNVEPVSGFPYQPGVDAYRDFSMLSDGLAGAPLIFREIGTTGVPKWFASGAAPTLTPTTTGTISNTTRPLMSWTYSDPNGDNQASWKIKVYSAAQYGAGGFNPDTSTPTQTATGTGINERSFRLPADLPNGTYRLYVQGTDSSGKFSSWAFSSFTMSVTLPATPTLTATPNNTDGKVTLIAHVSATIGGGVMLFEYFDEGIDNPVWAAVRNGYAVAVDGSNNATVVDYEAPQNVNRTYRAKYYQLSPFIASLPSSTATTTVNVNRFMLRPVSNPTAGGPVTVRKLTWKKSIAGASFQPVGRPNRVVIRDGAAKGAEADATFGGLNKTEVISLLGMLESDDELLLRTPHGQTWYVQREGDVAYNPLRAQPMPGEPYGIRYAYDLDVTLVEVDMPETLPGGSLIPLDGIVP